MNIVKYFGKEKFVERPKAISSKQKAAKLRHIADA